MARTLLRENQVPAARYPEQPFDAFYHPRPGSVNDPVKPRRGRGVRVALNHLADGSRPRERPSPVSALPGSQGSEATEDFVVGEQFREALPDAALVGGDGGEAFGDVADPLAVG